MNLLTVEDFIEESVADTNCSLHDKNDLKYLLILILNHISIVFKKSRLQLLHKVHQEVPHFLIMVNLLIIIPYTGILLLGTWVKVNFILHKEISEEIINIYLTLDGEG